MSKIDDVRKAMVEAMKAKDKDRKDSLSMLLAALKNKAIDKREDLTEAEEKRSGTKRDQTDKRNFGNDTCRQNRHYRGVFKTYCRIRRICTENAQRRRDQRSDPGRSGRTFH